MKGAFILSFTLIMSIICLSKEKKFLTNIETLIQSLEVNSNCNFLSNVISVDTKNDNYDLLMSYSTSEDCKYNCYINSSKAEKIESVKVSKHQFHNQYYNFLKFPNLKNFEKYTFNCVPVKKEMENIVPINTATEAISGNIQFPKNPTITNVIAFGDWSKTTDGSYTEKYLESKINSFDAIVFLGDQGYDMYQKEGKVGNEFLLFAKSVTSSIPFQVSTGNHETKFNFEDLKKRFIMPNKENSENLFYSYDINNIHFVAMNSEIPYKFNEQYKLDFQNWLKNDLKSTNKKWKIVYLHRPLYCSMPEDFHCISSSKSMRDILEEIIMEYKVDLVLAGHVHAYERLYPIYKEKVDINSVSKDKSIYNNPKYPVHIVCGAGGNRESYAKYNPKTFSYKTFAQVGVCELNITNDQINLSFISTKTKQVLDKFSIIKK